MRAGANLWMLSTVPRINIAAQEGAKTIWWDARKMEMVMQPPSVAAPVYINRAQK